MLNNKVSAKWGQLQCLGTGIGGMLQVLAAALGLLLLVAQSALAFSLVKYVGAAYLIYLGVRLLMRKDEAMAVAPATAQGVRRAVLEGVVVEALNVKTVLFFLAFLPQFASPTEPLEVQLALLGSICVALNTLVDVFVVFAAGRLLEASFPASGDTYAAAWGCLLRVHRHQDEAALCCPGVVLRFKNRIQPA